MTPERMAQLSLLEIRATKEETGWLLNRIGELESVIHEFCDETEDENMGDFGEWIYRQRKAARAVLSNSTESQEKV